MPQVRHWRAVQNDEDAEQRIAIDDAFSAPSRDFKFEFLRVDDPPVERVTQLLNE